MRVGVKPPDETLRAVLLAMVPENLEEHLELNIQHFHTYKKMHAEVVSFLEQKAPKALVDDGGAAPMGGHGKGGKGQGKPNASQVRCHTWEARTHGKGLLAGVLNSSFFERFSVVWLKLHGLSQGSPQGLKGKGKGKSAKGKSKGKMKGKLRSRVGRAWRARSNVGHMHE